MSERETVTEAVSEEAVEAAAKAMWPHLARMAAMSKRSALSKARAALEAALPLIVAGERERCAKIADQTAKDIPLAKMTKDNSLKRTFNCLMIGTAQKVAAAIRADKGGE